MTEVSTTCFGISLGASACVVTDSTGEIHRNELGGHTSAPLVAFTPEGRQIGEAAVMGLTANAKGSATEVGRLALLKYSTLVSGQSKLASRNWQFGHEAGDGDVLCMSGVQSGDGSPCNVSAVGLLGALLGKMRANCAVPEGTPVAIALPALGDDEATAARARSILHDAAAVGGWQLVAAPTAASAMSVTLGRKWPFGKADEGGPPKSVLIVDMGARTTIATIVKLTPPTPPAEKGGSPGVTQAEVICERADAFLGASSFNEVLFDHFAAKIQAQYGEAVEPASKRGLRLSGAIERIRKLVSTMSEAAATAENLIDGIDVPLKLSRDELIELGAPLLERLKLVLDGVLADAAGAAELPPPPASPASATGRCIVAPTSGASWWRRR